MGFIMDDFKKEIALRVEKEIEDFISDPLNIIEAYKKRLKDVEPKIQFYDMVIQSESEFLMREVSKTINFKDMGQNKLFKFLREKEIVNYDNEPYQRFIDGLYFSLKENKWVNPKTGQTNINLTPVVTQKGIDYIIKLLLKSGYVVNDR